MTTSGIAFLLSTPLFAVGLALAQSSPSPAVHQEVPPETIVMTVGDIKLTAAQFKALADALPEPRRAYANGAGRKQFAEEVARTLALAQEARREKLDKNPGFEIQAKYRVDDLLAGFEETSLANHIKVRDEALHAYYSAHGGEFERARARHILIRTPGSPVPAKPEAKERTTEGALAKARAVGQRVRNGEDFTKVAAAESDDPGSSQKGGEIGWFSPDQVGETFRDAAFHAKLGEIVGPVKTEFGYHILQVEEHEIKSFDQARPEIERKLLPEAIRNAIAELQKRTNPSFDPKFFGSDN